MLHCSNLHYVVNKEEGMINVCLVCISFNCTVVVPTPSLSLQFPTLGYKLVGDNIDIGVKTRYMRLERYENKSLHYFHCLAVQNRIDHSHKPDVHPDTCLPSPLHRASTLLPSLADDRSLRNDFITCVSRILVEHMPFFKHTFEDVVEWHIQHQYYNQMSAKSVVVCLYI